jgi:hypothetical protein
MTLPKNPQKFAQEWIEDWNRHDLNSILSHYSEEIELCSPFIVRLLGDSSGKLRGKKALENYFTQGLKAYPDLRFEWIEILIGVNSLVLYYRGVRRLLSAEFMSFNREGLVEKVIAHYQVPVAS